MMSASEGRLGSTGATAVLSMTASPAAAPAAARGAAAASGCCAACMARASSRDACIAMAMLLSQSSGSCSGEEGATERQGAAHVSSERLPAPAASTRRAVCLSHPPLYSPSPLHASQPCRCPGLLTMPGVIAGRSPSTMATSEGTLPKRKESKSQAEVRLPSRQAVRRRPPSTPRPAQPRAPAAAQPPAACTHAASAPASSSAHRLKPPAAGASPSLSADCLPPPCPADGCMSHSCTSSPGAPAAAAAAAAVPGLAWSPTSPISLILRFTWWLPCASSAWLAWCEAAAAGGPPTCGGGAGGGVDGAEGC